MRHRKAFNHLGRTKGHRRSLLANIASSLIMHKKIKTTTAKAKALRTYIEPLITRSKEDTTHSRRVVFSYLQSKEAVSELFREVSQKVGDRPGGYTRILKLGSRLGDNADMCIIELVDYNENLLAAKAGETGKSTRRRRRGGKGKEQATIESTPVETEEKAEAAEASVEEATKLVEEVVTPASETIEKVKDTETQEPVETKNEAEETAEAQKTEEKEDSTAKKEPQPEEAVAKQEDQAKEKEAIEEEKTEEKKPGKDRKDENKKEE